MRIASRPSASQPWYLRPFFWINAALGVPARGTGPRRSAAARGLAGAAAVAGLLLAGVASAAHPLRPQTADGMEVFLGVIPAEIMLGHPAGHPERSPHGSVPAWGEQYHLVVSLFDRASGERIRDAEVSATVSDVRLPGKRLAGPQKRLEPMLLDGAVGYGNYFNMPGSAASYRIELEIRRGGAARAAKVTFNYEHVVVPTKPRP